MARQLGERMTSNQIKRLSSDAIDGMSLPADIRLAMKANVAVIAALQSQIEVIEKRLQECVKPRPQYGLLTSVPGIGQTLATVILLETGPIDRFSEVGNFASYARFVDSVHTSNRKKKGEGNVKNGNKYLAWAFVEAANFARRFCPEAKRFHERKKSPDQQHRCHQGVGAQAGAGLLPHPEGGQAVRRNALLRLKDDADPASHVR